MTTLFKYDTRAPVVDWTNKREVNLIVVIACAVGLGLLALVAVCWPEARVP
jgi:hypothetical protein